MSARPLRLGAYVLPGDPVWLRSSLERYYPHVERLVVPVPSDGRGWTGRGIPVAECLAVIASVDTRGIAELVPGRWRSAGRPLDADTAQRQAALDHLGDSVDWVLQVDNDEVVPRPERLVEVVREADALGAAAVEWPMRVLYRRLGPGSYLLVTSPSGGAHHEYPGPVAVRAGARLTVARRTDGPVVRAVVRGDDRSLQVTRPAGPGETRLPDVDPDDAIWHNSWGRPPAAVWRKIRTWGHAGGARDVAYYALVWFPAPVTWRLLRNLHPRDRVVWPRLAPVVVDETLLAAEDRS